MAKEKGRSKQTPTVKNKKAYFNYEIADVFDAGVILTGSEVKSLRAGKANMGDSFAIVKREEVWLLKLHITPYSHSSYYNHEPMRKRKLLLHKREIKKLKTKIREQGYTLVPLKIYFNDRGLVKCQLGLAKGKKRYDKREDIKKRDVERDLMRKYKHQ